MTIGTSDGCADADIWARLDGHISGRVVDERGQAARGVHVQLADAQAIRNNTPTASLLDVQADENGVFTFRYMPDGTYAGRRIAHSAIWAVGSQALLREDGDSTRRERDRSGRGEHLTVPEFRLAPLPQERAVTVIMRRRLPRSHRERGSSSLARRSNRSNTAAEPSCDCRTGAEFVIEANAPDGYRVSSPSSIWVRRDDAGRVLEFSIVAQ